MDVGLGQGKALFGWSELLRNVLILVLVDVGLGLAVDVAVLVKNTLPS